MNTLKNKIYGIGLIFIGAIPGILNNDFTALLLFGSIGIVLIFAKDNWIS